MNNVSLYRTNALAGLQGFEAQCALQAEGFQESDRFYSPEQGYTIHQYEDQEGWVFLVTVDGQTGLVMTSYSYERGAQD